MNTNDQNHIGSSHSGNSEYNSYNNSNNSNNSNGNNITTTISTLTMTTSDSEQPYFDFELQRNVTVTVGQTGFLHCRVERLGDKDVSTHTFSHHIHISKRSNWIFPHGHARFSHFELCVGQTHPSFTHIILFMATSCWIHRSNERRTIVNSKMPFIYCSLMNAHWWMPLI